MRSIERYKVVTVAVSMFLLLILFLRLVSSPHIPTYDKYTAGGENRKQGFTHNPGQPHARIPNDRHNKDMEQLVLDINKGIPKYNKPAKPIPNIQKKYQEREGDKDEAFPQQPLIPEANPFRMDDLKVVVDRSARLLTDCVSGKTIRKVDNYVTTKFYLPKKWGPAETNHRRIMSLKRVYMNEMKNNTKLDPRYRNVRNEDNGPLREHKENAERVLSKSIDHVKGILHKDVITLLDMPCGDMDWMSHFLRFRTDVKYTGMHFLPDIITKHQERFSNLPGLTFVTQDIVTTPLTHSYDLIFSRMLIQHLSNFDTLKVLKHFSESGSSFLLSTDYPFLYENRKLPILHVWHYRPQNLQIPPYSLEAPLCIYPINSRAFLSLRELPLQQVVGCNRPTDLKMEELKDDDFDLDVLYYCA